MSVEIGGMRVRLKCINKAAKLRSVEVMVNAHVLQLPRREITSLQSLCHKKECWVNIGHTSLGIDGYCFFISGRFFQSGKQYIGERTRLHEAVSMMIEVVKPVLELL